MTPPIVVTMGQGTAEAYTPGDRELCISITTPGMADANLSPVFVAVLRLQFVDDQGADWRRRELVISPAQADQVIAFLAAHPDAPRVVVHCIVGASRSVSLALALEREGLCVFEKPDWWDRVEKPNGGIPNPGVFTRVIQASRRAKQAGGGGGE